MKPLPQHTSTTTNWYTPPEVTMRVRDAFDLQKIELDPASCEIANKYVNALYYWTKEQNSLSKTWTANNVFLNPPYGRKLTAEFVEKFYFEFSMRSFDEGILLINSNTATKYWQRAWKNSNAVCFPNKRISFINSEGVRQKSPPHANTLFYVGDRYYPFKSSFESFGVVSHIN